MTTEADPMPEATVVRYVTPEFGNRNKRVTVLQRTERIVCAIQAVRKGGENNLHHHKYLDGFWFVLSGAARFYTTDDEVIAELGPREGISVPHLYPYWFESTGDVPLEIMQIEVPALGESVPDLLDDRVDLVPRSGPLPAAEPMSG